MHHRQAHDVSRVRRTLSGAAALSSSTILGEASTATTSPLVPTATAAAQILSTPSR